MAESATGDAARISAHASLASYNTLRVDVRARRLIELHDADALPDALATAADGRVLILGRGSNVLFTRDFDGTVIVMAALGVEVTGEDAAGAHLRVAAGELWDDLVRWSLGQGYAGLENLIMIPGTVGAAPIQNIGAYGVEVAEFIDAIEAFDREAGKTVVIARNDCGFGYRNSHFKRAPQRYVVSAVRLVLPRDRTLRIEYTGLREQLGRMSVERATPYHIAEAVVALRTRKLPDPAVIGNAGSFFKNPIVPLSQAQALAAEYPSLPRWPTDGHRAKLSAAWLIEQCGLKGVREGDAGISNRHALVLVNHGHASGAQLWAFARQVRDTVAARFAIHLDPEPVIIDP